VDRINASHATALLLFLSQLKRSDQTGTVKARLSTLPFLRSNLTLTAPSPTILPLFTATTPMPLTAIRSNKLYNAQYPLLTAPLTSNLDAPSGLLAGMCLLPPPPFFCMVSSNFKLSRLFPCFLIFSCTTPFTSNLGAPPWWPRWECSWLHFPPGGTFDLSDASRRFAGLPFVSFSFAFR
jgi:hypothetical protein